MRCRFLIDRTLSLSLSLSLIACESSRASLLTNFGGGGVSKAERGKPDPSCGFYIKTSYIDHSCFSNERRSFIGDLLIVRATRNSAAGQEILLWNAWPKADPSYELTQANSRNWGFHCSCDICTHDRETSNKRKKKRAALLKKINAAGKHVVGEAGLTNIDKLLAAIEETHTVPAAVVSRLPLRNIYLALTRIHACIGSRSEASRRHEGSWPLWDS